MSHAVSDAIQAIESAMKETLPPSVEIEGGITIGRGATFLLSIAEPLEREVFQRFLVKSFESVELILIFDNTYTPHPEAIQQCGATIFRKKELVGELSVRLARDAYTISITFEWYF